MRLDVAALAGAGSAAPAVLRGLIRTPARRAAAIADTGALRQRLATLSPADRDEALAIARQVSTALVTVVQQVLAVRPPRFVVAKGGITSSDVAARGLGIERAMVRGPMLPGIASLWQPVDGPAQGIPYVVFAGNVGDDRSLLDVVRVLSNTPS